MRHPSPLVVGLAYGYAQPLLVLAPALFVGTLLEILAENRTYFLLPALTLVAVPAAVAGYVSGRVFSQPQHPWRFSAGAFVGASLAGSLLFWAGGADYAVGHRLTLALFGGPLISGFWVWLGLIIGISIALQRKPPHATPRPAAAKP